MSYPMMLTRFTKNQLYILAVLIDNVIQLKLGMNHKIKHAVVYGPLDLGGMVYLYIDTTQDKKDVGHLVRYLKQGKEMGQ